MAFDRNKRLTLDKACGATFAEIAEKYDMHPSRVDQIYKATLHKLGLIRGASAKDIGLALQRVRSPEYNLFHYEANTPEAFYWSGSLRKAI